MKCYCEHCDKDVEPEWADEGIGEYEYWGCKGFDSCMVASCPECGADLDADWSAYCAEQEAEWAEYRAEQARDDAYYYAM